MPAIPIILKCNFIVPHVFIHLPDIPTSKIYFNPAPLSDPEKQHAGSFSVEGGQDVRKALDEGRGKMRSKYFTLPITLKSRK